MSFGASAGLHEQPYPVGKGSQLLTNGITSGVAKAKQADGDVVVIEPIRSPGNQVRLDSVIKRD